MSKRSYAEYDGSKEAITKSLAQIDQLLATARGLKESLEQLKNSQSSRKTSEPAPEAKTRPDPPATLSDQCRKLVQSGEKLSQTVETILQSDSKSSKSQKLSSDSAQHVIPAGLPAPDPTSLTAWTLDDIPPNGTLPPLPPIADKIIEKACFTHTGMTAKPSDLSYEKLEWIGDSYLYVISSAFIYNTFPILAVGRSVQLREKIVKNDTLSQYTLAYGLDKRANFPEEFGLDGRSGGTSASLRVRGKVLGDIFESYFAAIILGNPNGLEIAVSFVKKLWASTLAYEIKEEFKAQQAHQSQANSNPTANAVRQEVNSKVELAKAIGGVNINIDYKLIAEKKAKDSKHPVYTMGVFLNGWGEKSLQLGYGSGLSKKDAGQKAAASALQNQKLMKRLTGIKKDFLDAVATQKPKEEC